jgi:hypothetical protein
MESFVPVEAWRGFALVLNFFTFFLSFSAISVGAIIRDRLLRRLDPFPLAGAVDWFLVGAGALTVRELAIILFHLGVAPAGVVHPVADAGVLVVGLSLFRVYLVFEKALRENRKG